METWAYFKSTTLTNVTTINSALYHNLIISTTTFNKRSSSNTETVFQQLNVYSVYTELLLVIIVEIEKYHPYPSAEFSLYK